MLISPCVWGIRHGVNRSLILSPQVKKGRKGENLGVNEIPRRTGGNTISPDVFPVMRSLLRRQQVFSVYSGRIWVMQWGFAHSWAVLHSLQGCPETCDVFRQFPRVFIQKLHYLLWNFSHMKHKHINISEQSRAYNRMLRASVSNSLVRFITTGKMKGKRNCWFSKQFNLKK